MASFWRDFSLPSPVDDILKNPNFTLNDLLDEDDVVVEVRNQKEELINYLTKKDIILQLVQYVVDDPKETDSEKVKFRYPAVSVEILCSEVDAIEKVLLQNEDLLDHILGFFNKPRVNMLLANLVVRIINTLLSSKSKEMLAYLKKNPLHIKHILNHLEIASITEIFARLINLDSEQDSPGTLQWLVEINFVEQLIGKYEINNIIIQHDVTQAILDVMMTSSWDSVLMEKFKSIPVCDKLMELMTNPENPNAFRYGIRIFIQMLKFLAIASEETYDSDEEEAEKKPKIDPNASLDQLPPPVQVLTKNIPKFCKLLKNPTKTSKLTSQSGEAVDAFGFQRLGILQCIETMMILNYSAVQNALIDSDFYQIVLDLLFEFPQNNFCHRMVEGLTSRLVEQLGPEGALKFLQSTKIVDRILKAESDNKAEEEQGKLRRQYMPYLHLIATSIQLVADNSEQVKSYVEAANGWTDFIAQVKREREQLEAMSRAEGKETEEPALFTPKVGFDSVGEPVSDAYEEGRDGDEEDLSLGDDVDMDSSNDADDYDIEQAEILLTKQEVEAFA